MNRVRLDEESKEVAILLVEDSETDAELMFEALRRGKLSNNIYHVKDGEEALRFLYRKEEFENATCPDLILLDLNMSGIGGRGVLRKLQADEAMNHIPIVILTASVHDQEHLVSSGLKPTAFLIKPVDMPGLIGAVQSIDRFAVTLVVGNDELQ